MSGSGRQCEKLDRSDGAHVAQLRRLVWLLLVWSFFMTLGLAVSISLQFILPRPHSSIKVPDNRKHLKLLMYDYQVPPGKSEDESIELKWQNDMRNERNVEVKVPEDGDYFLYLQVTLNDLKPNKSYTVNVDKFSDPNRHGGKILEGHINGSQLSTGLMGKGFLLAKGTILKVTCTPSVKLDSQKTYLGMIKLS